MKKVKETIARFFWNRGMRVTITIKSLELFLILSLAGLVVDVVFGVIVLVTTKNLFWGLTAICLGSVPLVLPWVVFLWQRDLPECKISYAEKILENYPQSAFKTGVGLIEKAKLTGKTDQLEVWIKAFREYEATVNELRELKSLAMDIPSQIRRLKRKAVDLHQSLESLAA